MAAEIKTCHMCGRTGARGFLQTVDGWFCIKTGPCLARVDAANRRAERAAAAADRAAAAEQRRINAGRCQDCVAEGVPTDRKLATDRNGDLRPGPRCVTHWRSRKKTLSHTAHARRLAENYELTPEQYWALYAMQGGKCFGCQHATGKTKRLAVDHDHELALEHGHDPKKGCIHCVRCLLCGQCNQIIGRLGVEALCRLIQVLTDPPARKWLAMPEDLARSG